MNYFKNLPQYATLQGDNEDDSTSSSQNDTESDSGTSNGNNNTGSGIAVSSKSVVAQPTPSSTSFNSASPTPDDGKSKTTPNISMGHPKMRIKLSLKKINKSIPIDSKAKDFSTTEDNGTSTPDPKSLPLPSQPSFQPSESMLKATTVSNDNGNSNGNSDLHQSSTNLPLAASKSKKKSSTISGLEHKKLPTNILTKKKKSLDASNMMRRKVKLPMKVASADVQVLSASDQDIDVDVIATSEKKVASLSFNAVTGSSQAQQQQQIFSQKMKKPPVGGRLVRLPALSSPGLLLPPPNGVTAPAGQALVSPALVFDATMQTVGYKRNHRGSSTKRQVEDLFDSNVKLALHFPGPLVPVGLWNGKKVGCEITLANELLTSLKNASNKHPDEYGSSDGSNKKRKRNDYMSFSDMAPTSLTIPYPEDYFQRHVDYVKQVKEREKAIMAAQQAELDALRNPPVEPTQWKNPVTIPPIPDDPEPPLLSEVFESTEAYDTDGHPIYLPKSSYVGHLDPNCFHITQGRYFGLTTNYKFDPSFYGANAPGICAIIQAGSGLAPVGIGGNTVVVPQTPIQTLLAECKSSKSFGNSNKDASKISSTSVEKTSSVVTDSFVKNDKNKSSKSEKSVKSLSTLATPTKKTSTTNNPSSTSKKANDPPIGSLVPTATLSELRKLMESDDYDMKEEMRDCIRRAAVRAGRLSRPNDSFVGVNEKIYPEISKAFSAHSGVRPCTKCKGNKQGAFHCRMRRKHKERDFEGGESHLLIEPLVDVPLEDLVMPPPLDSVKVADKKVSNKPTLASGKDNNKFTSASSVGEIFVKEFK